MSSLPVNNPDFSVGLTDITNFPGSLENGANPLENIDLFPSLFDLPAELISSAERFNELRSRPPQPTDRAEIAQLLEVLTPYIITPEVFNRLTASMTKIQYMWHTEIHDYIMRMQNQLKFIGEWNPNTQYQLHNKVSRPQSGAIDPSAGEMFICINRNGSRNNPLPTGGSFANAHWRRISTSTQGAPGIAVRWKGDWVNVQGQTFNIGDSIRFNGVEYYCQIDGTTQSPAQNQDAWETFWPVIWITGGENARPLNGSMRQNTILYRTQNNTTYVERWTGNGWENMDIHTAISSIRFNDSTMLPEELTRMRQATNNVRSDLQDEINRVEDSVIGDLQNMPSVPENQRTTVRSSVQWTANQVVSAHRILEEQGGRLNTLEGVEFESLFLSLNGSGVMSGNLNLGTQSLDMVVNGNATRSVVRATGTDRANVEIGSPNASQLILTASNNNVRVGNNTVIHSGNIGSQTVANANNVGDVAAGNVARRNEQNTFTANQTINGVLTVGGSISRVRSNEGSLTLGSAGSDTIVLNGNNTRLNGELNTGHITCRGWMQSDALYVRNIRNFDGGRTYMNTTAATHANFPMAGGLAVNGNRIFIQSATPTGQSTGDIWLW